MTYFVALTEHILSSHLKAENIKKTIYTYSYHNKFESFKNVDKNYVLKQSI